MIPASANMEAQPGNMLSWFDEARSVGYEQGNSYWACNKEGQEKAAEGA